MDSLNLMYCILKSINIKSYFKLCSLNYKRSTNVKEIVCNFMYTKLQKQ